MTARWITADVFDGLAALEDASVDLVVTSPPLDSDALPNGHDAVGIDLDERNYVLALERVGPMLLGEAEMVGGVR